MQSNDPFGARTSLTTGSDEVEIYSLKALDEKVGGDVFSLPFSVRVLLEPLLRNGGILQRPFSGSYSRRAPKRRGME